MMFILYLFPDRDCAKWKVDQRLVERRRNVFWELFTCDGWHVSGIYCCFPYCMSNSYQNLANGKPPSFVLRYTDCQYPEEDCKVYDKDGKAEASCELLQLIIPSLFSTYIHFPIISCYLASFICLTSYTSKETHTHYLNTHPTLQIGGIDMSLDGNS